ncbi:hypothetical protein [Kitasatospora mediocidica]|uniref:hypothetical protein n=1 Tax=Kitasatospora mediocidica TaxID=58352 RepID=UPI000690DF99|nr:hypothetical protein [Kitasatospora mediocidica]
MPDDSRLTLAEFAYHRAVFADDRAGLPAAGRALDAVAADLALARGRLLHADFLDSGLADPREAELFAEAARCYAALGDRRGEGEALFWVGLVNQMIDQDDVAAAEVFDRALSLANETGDRLTASYILRHIGIGAHRAGQLDVARERLTESTRLRRELGFEDGAAANLVGLAYLAAQQDRRDDAARHLDEGDELASRHAAVAVSRQLAQARRNLGFEQSR